MTEFPSYLARATGQRVLFTTYVATLPRVLESLLERLAPDMVGRVDSVGVHKFAKDLLDERGIPFRARGLEARQAFDDAWNAIRASSPLRSAHVGRKHALLLETRQAVWDLFEAYESGLRERRALDWEDVVLLARQSLCELPLTRYGAVIVDEAQDLSCAMVSMLHGLIGDEGRRYQASDRPRG